MKALLILGALSLGQQDLNYEATKQLAIALGKPVVIGVDCDPPTGPWLSVKVRAPWYKWNGACTILSRPDGSDLYHVETLVPNCTSNMVFSALVRQPPCRSVAPARQRAGDC